MVLPKRLMIWIAIVLGVYLLVVALAFLFQDRLIFIGAGWGRGVALQLPNGVRVDRLRLADGSRFRVAICEPDSPPSSVLVFFDGNAADLRSGVVWARVWADHGACAVAVEYPGYGDSEGRANVESFREAAEVAGAFAADLARSKGVPLVAGGVSIGTFNAVHLASRGVPARLLLLAPPTSMVDAASQHYPWLPVRWLLRHRFDSLSQASNIRCPVLILHGDCDTIIPIKMGRTLHEAIGSSCDFLVATGHGHNDLPVLPSGPFDRRLREFLAGR